MKYNISYKKDGVYQAAIVDAASLELLNARIEYHGTDGAEILGIREALPDDLKPGKPTFFCHEIGISYGELAELQDMAETVYAMKEHPGLHEEDRAGLEEIYFALCNYAYGYDPHEEN